MKLPKPWFPLFVRLQAKKEVNAAASTGLHSLRTTNVASSSPSSRELRSLSPHSYARRSIHDLATDEMPSKS